MPPVQYTGPLKPCATRRGSQPAVIDMRVGEDDGVDGFGRNRQRRPVAQAQLLQALEQSAIEQDAMAIDFEQCLEPVTVRAAPRNVSVAMLV